MTSRRNAPGAKSAVSAQVERENPEPVESRGPLPALFLVLFGVFGASGFTYLVRHGGDDFSFAGDERSPQIVAASTEVSGPAVFQASCAACHQPTGLEDVPAARRLDVAARGQGDAHPYRIARPPGADRGERRALQQLDASAPHAA